MPVWFQSDVQVVVNLDTLNMPDESCVASPLRSLFVPAHWRFAKGLATSRAGKVAAGAADTASVKNKMADTVRMAHSVQRVEANAEAAYYYPRAMLASPTSTKSEATPSLVARMANVIQQRPAAHVSPRENLLCVRPKKHSTRRLRNKRCSPTRSLSIMWQPGSYTAIGEYWPKYRVIYRA